MNNTFGNKIIACLGENNNTSIQECLKNATPPTSKTFTPYNLQ